MAGPLNWYKVMTSGKVGEDDSRMSLTFLHSVIVFVELSRIVLMANRDTEACVLHPSTRLLGWRNERCVPSGAA